MFLPVLSLLVTEAQTRDSYGHVLAARKLHRNPEDHTSALLIFLTLFT